MTWGRPHDFGIGIGIGIGVAIEEAPEDKHEKREKGERREKRSIDETIVLGRDHVRDLRKGHDAAPPKTKRTHHPHAHDPV